jgi:hypothetical protein
MNVWLILGFFASKKRKYMVKRIVLTLVLAALAVAAGNAQTPGSFSDGRNWRDMAEASKIYFMVGYREGIATGATMAALGSQVTNAASTAVEILAPVKLTMQEFVEALDDFYREPLNRPIAVKSAIYIIGEKAKGESAEKIDKDIAFYRKQALAR